VTLFTDRHIMRNQTSAWGHSRRFLFLRATSGYPLTLAVEAEAHIPHSRPVMSEPIHVHVVDAEAASVTVRRHSSPPKARVYFVYPRDGDFVSPTPVIQFGLVNMSVAPAGVDKANTGHHHLLIDVPLPPLDQRKRCSAPTFWRA
jgi:Domain of unknown function (DUF4399)